MIRTKITSLLQHALPATTGKSYSLLLAAATITLASQFALPEADAAGYRQSYGAWSYRPATTYYYSYYYYKPAVTYTTYRHHYCIYYPSRPQYVYYYNPVSRVYWGRYDLKAKGYSMLAKKDRKAKLDDIPEKVFPKPGEMPPIPESEDGERMKPIDPKTLPKADAPEELPTQ